MNENMKIPRPIAYSVSMMVNGSWDYHTVVYCSKRSQIRYAYFKQMDFVDCGYDYKENFLNVKLKTQKMGEAVLKNLFKEESLLRTLKNRKD